MSEPSTPAAPLALVTGGAKRVGRATSLALARDGFDLIVTYNASEEDVRSLCGEIESLGRSCTIEKLPLDDPGHVLETGARLAEIHGRLDALVHNASVYEPTPIDTLSPDAALSQYRINALAPLLLSRALAPLLAASERPGGGSIVAMCDIHAMGRPRAGFSAYAMSKAALTEMVRTLARELAPAVRVNGVAPGVVAWPEQGHESDEQSQRAYLSRVPLARAGTPEDAAEAVRWLTSGATYTTGQIIRVDGGRFIA